MVRTLRAAEDWDPPLKTRSGEGERFRAIGPPRIVVDGTPQAWPRIFEAGEFEAASTWGVVVERAGGLAIDAKRISSGARDRVPQVRIPGAEGTDSGTRRRRPFRGVDDSMSVFTSDDGADQSGPNGSRVAMRKGASSGNRHGGFGECR